MPACATSEYFSKGACATLGELTPGVEEDDLMALTFFVRRLSKWAEEVYDLQRAHRLLTRALPQREC
eukprot:711916-Rhodomonas_salina.2